MNTIYNQDIINGAYNPDFLTNSLTTEEGEAEDFNDQGSLEENENITIIPAVITALQRLLKRFKCLEAIPDSHIALAEIENLTQMYWDDIKQFYAEQIQLVFGEHKSRIQANSLENRRLALCQSLFARVDNDYKTANNEVKGLENAISNLTEAKKAAETTKILNEYMTGTAAKEATEKAILVIRQAETQLPTLIQAEKQARQNRARLILEHDLAKARIKAATDLNILVVNTGDPVTDAEVYAKIASNVCYKIASLNNAVAVAKSQVGANEASMTYSIRDMENAGGGVYDSSTTTDRITKLERARELQYVIYAACEFGYELATDARDSESQWWPDFVSLSNGVKDARQRINAGSIRKAQERAKAVATALDNGY